MLYCVPWAVKVTALDNDVMEKFYHPLKVELIYQNHYQTRRETQKDIFEYIEIFIAEKDCTPLSAIIAPMNMKS